MKIRDRKIIIAYNGARELRYGFHREELFWAIGCWPVIFACESRFSAERRRRIEERFRHLHDPL